MRTAVSVSRWEVDVADRGAGVEAAQAITDAHGAPDALFNVAGLIHVGRHFDSDFDHIHPPGASARNHLIRSNSRAPTGSDPRRLGARPVGSSPQVSGLQTHPVVVSRPLSDRYLARHATTS